MRTAQVVRAQRAAQPVRHGDEQGVADGVAAGVVDALEPVEVAVEDGQPAGRATPRRPAPRAAPCGWPARSAGPASPSGAAPPAGAAARAPARRRRAASAPPRGRRLLSASPVMRGCSSRSRHTPSATNGTPGPVAARRPTTRPGRCTSAGAWSSTRRSTSSVVAACCSGDRGRRQHRAALLRRGAAPTRSASTAAATTNGHARAARPPTAGPRAPRRRGSPGCRRRGSTRSASGSPCTCSVSRSGRRSATATETALHRQSTTKYAAAAAPVAASPRDDVRSSAGTRSRTASAEHPGQHADAAR